MTASLGLARLPPSRTSAQSLSRSASPKCRRRHSQTTTTLQPSASRASTLARSRAWLRSNLACQYSALSLGMEASRQPACLCQKQPCTKMQVRWRLSTRSGLPGRSLRQTRKRRPLRWTRERRSFSGLVSRLLMCDMTACRWSLVMVSAMAILLLRPAEGRPALPASLRSWQGVSRRPGQTDQANGPGRPDSGSLPARRRPMPPAGKGGRQA